MKSFKKFYAPALAAIIALSCTLPTHAQGGAPVLLANQWKAKQQWIYDLKVTGKMDVRFPPDTPMLGRMQFKGMDISFSNAMMLDVLKSNDKGEGVVALRVANIEMTASTPMGRMEMKDGTMQAFVNGQPFGQPTPVPTDSLLNPDRAFILNARGHFAGTEAIPDGVRPDLKLPPYVQNLMQAFDPRTLPALWPEKAVAPGDQWKNELSLPLADKTAEEKNIGNFEWTYVGEEADANNANRKLQRLLLEGNIKITGEQATLLAAQIGDTRPGTPQDTIQKVSGDVIFDTQIGQIHSANLKVQFYTARQAQRQIGERTIDDSSWTIFDGNLQLARNENPVD